MAKLTLNFEVGGYTASIELDQESGHELIGQIPAVIERIKNIGGKAIGSPDLTRRCAADYLIAQKGSTPETFEKTYVKVFGVRGTWIAKFGVPIWDEVLEAHNYNPASLQIGKKYSLKGCDVIFSIKTDSETGKQNPEKVIKLIKVQ